MEAVRIVCHWESGYWWAESPDIERWSAAADTFADLARLAAEGVEFALCGKPCDPVP